MELFIPSILALIIAAVIVMFVLPRLSSVILGALALVFLAIAAYQHYNFFYTEYRQSTWQLPLLEYAPYLLLGGLVLFLIFFIINFIGTNTNAQAGAPLVAMNAAVERVANQAPTVAGVTNAVTNAANNALKAVGLGNGRVPANNAVRNARFSQI
jgi:lipopolysaccharide export LptBFGC system permease protein LptF